MPHTVVLEHAHSRARRALQLLKFSRSQAAVWWPLCGYHVVDLHDGKLVGNSADPRAGLWQIDPSDLKRLQRRRPLALYDERFHSAPGD